jgi:hypothetical protein
MWGIMMWIFNRKKEAKKEAEECERVDQAKMDIENAVINYGEALSAKLLCLHCRHGGKMVYAKPDLSMKDNPGLNPNRYFTETDLICLILPGHRKVGSTYNFKDPLIECPFFQERA